MALPEAGKVLGDLLGAAARREQVERQRKPALADGRATRHSEEILQSRADRGRLAGSVLDAQLPPAWQRDLIRRELVELRRQKTGSHVRLAQLPQRRGSSRKLLGARAHPGLVERQDPGLGAMLRDQLDPPSQTGDLLGVRECFRVIEQHAGGCLRVLVARQLPALLEHELIVEQPRDRFDALARRFPDELRLFPEHLRMVEEPFRLDRAGQPHQHAGATRASPLFHVDGHHQIRFADGALGGEPRRAPGREQHFRSASLRHPVGKAGEHGDPERLVARQAGQVSDEGGRGSCR